jgi:hypothetical protein
LNELTTVLPELPKIKAANKAAKKSVVGDDCSTSASSQPHLAPLHQLTIEDQSRRPEPLSNAPSNSTEKGVETVTAQNVEAGIMSGSCLSTVPQEAVAHDAVVNSDIDSSAASFEATPGRRASSEDLICSSPPEVSAPMFGVIGTKTFYGEPIAVSSTLRPESSPTDNASHKTRPEQTKTRSANKNITVSPAFWKKTAASERSVTAASSPRPVEVGTVGSSSDNAPVEAKVTSPDTASMESIANTDGSASTSRLTTPDEGQSASNQTSECATETTMSTVTEVAAIPKVVLLVKSSIITRFTRKPDKALFEAVERLDRAMNYFVETRNYGMQTMGSPANMDQTVSVIANPEKLNPGINYQELVRLFVKAEDMSENIKVTTDLLTGVDLLNEYYTNMLRDKAIDKIRCDCPNINSLQGAAQKFNRDVFESLLARIRNPAERRQLEKGRQGYYNRMNQARFKYTNLKTTLTAISDGLKQKIDMEDLLLLPAVPWKDISRCSANDITQQKSFFTEAGTKIPTEVLSKISKFAKIIKGSSVKFRLTTTPPEEASSSSCEHVSQTSANMHVIGFKSIVSSALESQSHIEIQGAQKENVVSASAPPEPDTSAACITTREQSVRKRSCEEQTGHKNDINPGKKQALVTNHIGSVRTLSGQRQ